MADAGALNPPDDTVIHPDASAKNPVGGHYTEDFWNTRIIGVSTELFFMITHEACLYREVPYECMSGRRTTT